MEPAIRCDNVILLSKFRSTDSPPWITTVSNRVKPSSQHQLFAVLCTFPALFVNRCLIDDGYFSCTFHTHRMTCCSLSLHRLKTILIMNSLNLSVKLS